MKIQLTQREFQLFMIMIDSANSDIHNCSDTFYKEFEPEIMNLFNKYRVSAKLSNKNSNSKEVKIEDFVSKEELDTMTENEREIYEKVFLMNKQNLQSLTNAIDMINEVKDKL
jgi:hypothetical protein